MPGPQSTRRRILFTTWKWRPQDVSVVDINCQHTMLLEWNYFGRHNAILGHWEYVFRIHNPTPMLAGAKYYCAIELSTQFFWSTTFLCVFRIFQWNGQEIWKHAFYVEVIISWFLLWLNILTITHIINKSLASVLLNLVYFALTDLLKTRKRLKWE